MLVVDIYRCPRITQGMLFEMVTRLPYPVRDHGRYVAVIMALLLRDSAVDKESDSVIAAYWGGYLHDIGKATFNKSLVMQSDSRTPIQNMLYAQWPDISCELFQRYGIELQLSEECFAITERIIAFPGEDSQYTFPDTHSSPDKYQQAYSVADYLGHQIVGVDKRKVIKRRIKPAIQSALSFCEERGYEEIGKTLVAKRRELVQVLENATAI